MKQKIVLTLFAAILIVTLCSNSGGYGANITGSTGASSGCAACHGSTSSIATTVELDSAGIAVTSYRPGQAYTVKISATNSTGLTLPGYGFQLSVVKSTNAGTASAVLGGTWGTMPSGVSNHGIYLGHNTRLSPTSGTGTNGTIYSKSIPWTAPVAGTGSLKIYGILNAVNNNNNDDNGDKAMFATPVTITEAVAAAPVASVSIAITSGSNPTCSGVPVTFTATPTNGGTAPTYQWKVGSTVVGTGTTYTSSTLATGNVVTCIMTSNLSGVSGSPATSNAITMTVNSSVVDSVNITSTATTICTGTSVTFTAHPFNGGTPSYQWKVGTTVVGTGSTYTSSTLANGNVVTCIMTPTGTCVTPATSTSNAITMTVNPTVTPTIHITTPTTTVCPSTLTTFTATVTNAGANPTYQWLINGASAGSNSNTFTTATLTNGAIVTCQLTSNATCASPATVTSNGDTMTVSGTLTPTVSVTGASSVCSGAPDTLTAHITGGGTSPSFVWRVGGNITGTNSSSLIIPSVTAAGSYTCTLTSSSACASPTSVTSSPFSLNVSPAVTPAIQIATPQTTVCQGASVTFSSNVTNGGSSPAYQWLVNSVPSGSSGSFSTSSLADGAVVSCVLTSNAQCASTTTAGSNTLTMTVNNAPAATLVPSGSVGVCTGDSLLLTAGGGTRFHWSDGDSTATIYVRQGGSYTVTVTDANGCSAAPATGATVTVHTPVVPTISRIGDTITASEPGIQYQWRRNDTILGGRDTTQSITLQLGGSYKVTITDINGCRATSLAYIFTYTPDTTGSHDTTHVGIVTPGQELGIKLYPVPNQGTFVVEMKEYAETQMVIYDIYGKAVYQRAILYAHQQVSDADLPAGLYFVQMAAHGRIQTIKMQVTRE